MVATLEQKKQGFDVSSVVDIQQNVQQRDQSQKGQRMQYPSTPKDFQTFDRLKAFKYNGNMMTSDARSEMYWD